MDSADAGEGVSAGKKGCGGDGYGWIWWMRRLWRGFDREEGARRRRPVRKSAAMAVVATGKNVDVGVSKGFRRRPRRKMAAVCCEERKNNNNNGK